MRFEQAPLLIIGALAAGSIVCGIACSSPTSETNNPINPSIKNFEVNQTIKTLSKNFACEGEEAMFDDSLKTYSNVQLYVEWPNSLGGKNIAPLQDSLVKALCPDTVITGIDAALTTSASRPEGMNQFKITAIDSIPQDKPSMVYSKMTSITVKSFNPDYVVYKISNYTYSGGAHGINESHYINYDLNKGEALNFEKIFVPGYEDLIIDKIKDALMEQYSVSSIEELQERGIFTDQLFVSHNIYLEGSDVVFHYNPYEIGPYSLGSINVYIPNYAINEILTPTARELLSKVIL